MNSFRMATCLAAIAATFSGCGGGGDDGKSSSASNTGTAGAAGAISSTAEGLYTGSSTGGRSIVGLVLDDGSYYFIYSREGLPGVPGGVIQGSGSANAGTFSSSDTRDFNVEDLEVLPASLTASYVAKQDIGGTVTYSGNVTTTFKADYSTDYDITPSLANLAGSYNGTVAFSEGAESAHVAISSAGVVSGNGTSGCAVSGSAAPRARGNVYDLAITFGASPCLHAGETFHGIAYVDATAKRLYAAAPDAARDDGVLFIGTRP